MDLSINELRDPGGGLMGEGIKWGEETEEKERMRNEKLAKAEYAWPTSVLTHAVVVIF